MGPLYDFQPLHISSAVQFTADKSNTDLYRAIGLLNKPRQWPDRPLPILGIETEKSDKGYVFDSQKLREKIAPCIAERVVTVSVDGPDDALTGDLKVADHHIPETIQDLALSSSVAMYDKKLTREPDEALDGIVGRLGSLQDKGIDARYDYLERYITIARGAYQLDTLATVVSALRDPDTTQQPHSEL